MCVYSIIIFWFYIQGPLSSVHPHRPPKRHVTLRTWPLTAPNNWSIEGPTEIRFDPNRFLWISKLKGRLAIKISHLYDSFLFNKKGFKGTFVRLLEKHFSLFSGVDRFNNHNYTFCLELERKAFIKSLWFINYKTWLNVRNLFYVT